MHLRRCFCCRNHRLNVLGFDEQSKIVYPMKNSKKSKTTVNLLLLDSKHYVLIKNVSRLLSSQASKSEKTKFVCSNCLIPFAKKEVLDKHLEYCENHESAKTTMPKKGSILEFKNHKHKMRVTIVVHAEFESFTKPIQTCQPSPEKSYTKAYQKHEPSGFCYYIVCNGKKLKPVLYTKRSENENVGEIFVRRIQKSIGKVWPSEVKAMVMTEEDKCNFDNAPKCWICEEHFIEGDKKVRDHDHFTGKCRDCAHQKCYALYRKPKFEPVVLHNLSGYDAHLFVKNLNSDGSGHISCIPNSEERYISFSKSIYDENKKFKYKFRFIESFKFMPTSLYKLVNNLEKHQFKHMKQTFSDEQCEILLRKGVFPYDWFDSFEKLGETKLREKEIFYSKLNGCDITDIDFSHAKRVWERFGYKTFRDYHDLYMKLLVSLLADVFEILEIYAWKNMTWIVVGITQLLD